MSNNFENISLQIDLDKKEINKKFKVTADIDYNQFVELIIKQAEYYQAFNNKKVGYVIDGKNELLLKKLHSHLIDPLAKKGFFVSGSNGTGKSLTMLSFASICNKIAEASRQPIQRFMKASNIILNKELDFSKGNLYVDELGREEVQINTFGTKSYPILDIIADRYDNGMITHVITNFRKEDLKPKYGNYIIDRFNEMFEFIEIKGESNRK